jgi:hypothetical protein
VSDTIVSEYLDLCEQIAVEALFAEAAVAQGLYDRLDRLWYVEMTDAHRREAEVRLAAKGRAWHTARGEEKT